MMKKYALVYRGEVEENKVKNWVETNSIEKFLLQKNDVFSWIEKGPDLDIIKKIENFGGFIANVVEYECNDNGNPFITGIPPRRKVKTKDQQLTTSQIRAVFTKLKEIDAKPGNFEDTKKAELLMMKPLVAYAAGRHDKKGIEVFKNYIINPGIDKIFEATQPDEMNKRFKNFVKLLEAVLAYHKAHGGN